MFFRRKVAKLLRKSRSANGQLLKPSTNSLSRKPANNGGTASLEELNYAAILRSVGRVTHESVASAPTGETPVALGKLKRLGGAESICWSRLSEIFVRAFPRL